MMEEVIKESSLSRTQEYMAKYDCATISAFRPRTKAENKAESSKLGKLLTQEGFTHFLVDGSWVDNFGKEDAKEGKEITYFVVNDKNDKDFKKKIWRLGHLFDQDSVMIYPKGSNPYLQGTSKRKNAYPAYKEKDQKGKVEFGKEAEFMTRVNGRPYAAPSVDTEYFNY